MNEEKFLGGEGVGVAGEGILSRKNKNETIWRHLKKEKHCVFRESQDFGKGRNRAY